MIIVAPMRAQLFIRLFEFIFFIWIECVSCQRCRLPFFLDFIRRSCECVRIMQLIECGWTSASRTIDSVFDAILLLVFFFWYNIYSNSSVSVCLLEWWLIAFDLYTIFVHDEINNKSARHCFDKFDRSSHIVRSWMHEYFCLCREDERRWCGDTGTERVEAKKKKTRT